MGNALFGRAWQRPMRMCTAVACALAVWMIAGPASAVAGEAHPFLFSFGSFSNPNGIAVEEATGDVYVADIGTDSVRKFDANGNPVDFSSIGSNDLTGAATPAGSFSFPTEAGEPAAIAIDNSTSASDPSAGDLYVMDAGHGVVDKFSPSGAYIGHLSPGSTPLGLGVEANGRLRIDITAFDSGFTDYAVQIFDNSLDNTLINTVKPARENNNDDSGLLPGDGFAVAPNGDTYLLDKNLGERSGCDCFEKRSAGFEPLGEVDYGSADVGAAVDPATGHLYIDAQSTIEEWDTGAMNGKLTVAGHNEHELSTGALVSSFGSMQLSSLSGEGGIAVNGKSEQVYVSNPADGKVYVFGTGAASVVADAPVNVTQTEAKLQGAVDSHGAAVTSCRFEYEAPGVDWQDALEAPTYAFTHSVPCEQDATQIGAGSGPVPVSADIRELKPATLYDYRLVIEGSNGKSFSDGRFASAPVGFGFKNFDVEFLNEDGTPDVRAGSHPYEMLTNVALNIQVVPRERGADARYARLPDGNVRDIVVDLPPGLVGDPNATAKKCTLAELEVAAGGRCPPESEVGELEAEFSDYTYFQKLKEPLYNMVPPYGVAVQLGGQFVAPDVFVNAGVEAGGDYPVRSTSEGIPQIEPLIASRLKVFGVVGSGEQRKAFLTLPTGCTGPLRSTATADSYRNPGHFVETSSVTRETAGNPVALSGCSKLEFPPSISVEPDSSDASTSSGLTVGVHVSQKGALNPEGLAESALRDTTVTLPEGVTINPSGADGLESCSEGLAGFEGFKELNSEFEPGVKTATFTPEMPAPLHPGANFCPNGSKIGTVEIKTPLLEHELKGAVYLASQNANPFGSLVAMYLIAEEPASGTLIKLTGEVKLSPTGQIVTTFQNTPDLPFEDLQLRFFGGERAPLSTPARCGTYTTQAVFTPWDGNGPVTSESSFTVEHGPHGGPCPGASLPFDPSLTAGTTSIQAGGFSPFTMTMSREDGQQNLQSISMKMPAGLSGLLTGAELCGEAQANAGTCGPNSQIGETIVSVGVGNDPFSVTGGKVYITGPYKGAPFGLSIVNPAKAGPYDLGEVIVRAKIEVDPTTAALTVTSDNEGQFKIPTILQGIPLQIKHVNVTINRPDFTFNPTNCEKMQITGDLHSAEGGSSAIAVPFQATNCASLSFKPGFAVSTSSRTSRKDGASLHVVLSYPKGPFGTAANVRSVKVELPKKLPSRLPTLQKACIDTVFNSNPAACPAASRVGSAKAITPLVPVPLEGPAYFVSHGGKEFPELVLVLQGYGLTIDLHGETFINKKTGVTSSTFRTVPDQPVTRFELNLPEGPYSALAANGNLCAASLTMPTWFTAQNGATIHRSTPIKVTGCKPAVRVLRHRVSGKSATIVAQVPSAGRLVVGGKGVSRVSRTVGRAGDVTVKLSLSGAERRFLARHRGRKLTVHVKLTFTPKHGKRIAAAVTLLMR